jgi:predicted phage terminase large subunit-like protein
MSDYSVIGTFAVTPDNDLLVLDIFRAKIEQPDLRQAIKNGYFRFQAQEVGIETKTIGLGLYQDLKRDGLPVIELKAEVDKLTRALPIAARYAAGMVYHPRKAAWLGDFESELLSFPSGKHDDQVDVVAYAGLILAEMAGLRVGDIVTSGVKLAASRDAGAFLT